MAPEARFVVEPVSAIWLAAPWTTVKAPRRAGGEPGGGRFHRHRADEGAGDRLRGDAAGGRRRARAGDGAGAGLLGEGDDGGVVGGDGVAGGVLERGGRTRVAPEVRLAVEPVRAIWAAAPWTTVKAERAGGQAARGRFHRDRADERRR